MSTFMSENFLKIVALVLTIIAILGSIVQFMSFKVEMHGKQLDRQYLMFGQYIAGAPFLTDDIPEYRKGVLSATKLDSFDSVSFAEQFNFPHIEKYFVNICAPSPTCDNEWLFGDDSIKTEKYKLWEYPVAINMVDTIVPGKMLVYVPKVE